MPRVFTPKRIRMATVRITERTLHGFEVMISTYAVPEGWDSVIAIGPKHVLVNRRPGSTRVDALTAAIDDPAFDAVVRAAEETSGWKTIREDLRALALDHEGKR